MTDKQILEIVETILPRGRTYSPEVWLDFAHKIAAAQREEDRSENEALRQDKEYAWKNTHILEAERQKQDKVIEALRKPREIILNGNIYEFCVTADGYTIRFIGVIP